MCKFGIMYGLIRKICKNRACTWDKNNQKCGELFQENFDFIYLFGVLRHFQHCTGHITTGSWEGRGYQYIQFVRVLYCKLPTNGK